MIPHDERPIPSTVGRGRLVGISILGLLVIGAALVATSAIIHLYLWGKEDGYRHVPTIGPMFLAQGIGCLLAVACHVRSDQDALRGVRAADSRTRHLPTHRGLLPTSVDFEEVGAPSTKSMSGHGVKIQSG